MLFSKNNFQNADIFFKLTLLFPNLFILIKVYFRIETLSLAVLYVSYDML